MAGKARLGSRATTSSKEAGPPDREKPIRASISLIEKVESSEVLLTASPKVESRDGPTEARDAARSVRRAVLFEGIWFFSVTGGDDGW
jgi:hypothetical protein